MSNPEANNPPRSMVVQKPKSNIYTTLLGISALAITIGCALLLMEIVTYSGSYSPFEIYKAIGGP